MFASVPLACLLVVGVCPAFTERLEVALPRLLAEAGCSIYCFGFDFAHNRIEIVGIAWKGAGRLAVVRFHSLLRYRETQHHPTPTHRPDDVESRR